MAKIEKIIAREILDSRGNPTVSCTVFLNNDKYYFSSVPSGASTGSTEAYELRDSDASRYAGLGVLKAVDNINTKINNLFSGQDLLDPITADKKLIELDGTENKSNLGANAILAVSLAINRANADLENKRLYRFINQYYQFSSEPSLPTPLVNVINGGQHADSNLDFQEFWIIPEGFNSFKEKLRASSEIFHELGKILKSNGYDTDIGNEGGYAPDWENTDLAWEFIIKAISEAGYHNKIALGMDAGSNGFYNNHDHKYNIKLDKKILSGTELINYYIDWIKKYKLKYLEDPLQEEDWGNWQKFKKSLELIDKDIVLIGDDLFTTNKKRLKKGIKENVANGIIIKPNQIGTVSEAIETIKMAHQNDMVVIVSHRSGETCDDFIADLAVGSGAEFIKTGSISRGERICKYNRLLNIEEELI